MAERSRNKIEAERVRLNSRLSHNRCFYPLPDDQEIAGYGVPRHRPQSYGPLGSAFTCLKVSRLSSSVSISRNIGIQGRHQRPSVAIHTGENTIRSASSGSPGNTIESHQRCVNAAERRTSSMETDGLCRFVQGHTATRHHQHHAGVRRTSRSCISVKFHYR